MLGKLLAAVGFIFGFGVVYWAVLPSTKSVARQPFRFRVIQGGYTNGYGETMFPES
jgi:hypothetical protein